MARLSLDTADGPLDTEITAPGSGAGPWPGVVVVHDVYGLSADVLAISRRIAQAGYLVATPRLYRGGPRCVVRVLRELMAQRGRAFDDVGVVRRHLETEDRCTGRVAIVGFCMGGQFALLTAPSGFAVSAPFYGVPLPTDIDEALAGACPIVASLGERDPWGRGAAPRLRHALEINEVVHDLEVYPRVGHAFANQLPVQPVQRVIGFGYDEDAAEDAWRRVFAFFDRHLAPASEG